MAKTVKKSGDEPEEITICRNRRALHEYEISDRIECGIVLVGTEVKSLRDGHANLEDAYAKIERDEVWLVGCEIPEYLFGNRLNHAPKRQRKLLMRRAEIGKFAAKADERGFTLIPLRMYFKNGIAKVEIAIGRGKQNYDKRQTLKKADAKREIDRAMAQRRKQ
ncbi:SsrA-binding protein SmpB [Fimbriiglobus ruber]|uniref:SsrA-binding protein n=1 Tax=Fimbriiglobus ruber TaxID=1908690 RepID=A0A225E328_9BACT|nr:SsrA-binding protein SmpB [Fimbriiglobus ruber]OWK43889.1 tmRNA-binding protein SmpB [Fimbriiglobus ruber]